LCCSIFIKNSCCFFNSYVGWQKPQPLFSLSWSEYDVLILIFFRCEGQVPVVYFNKRIGS
jgi:hypothetical protein